MPASTRPKHQPDLVDGDSVKAIRALTGQSAKSIAACVGISPQFLCDVENGRRDLKPDDLAVLAKVLGVPVSALLQKRWAA